MPCRAGVKRQDDGLLAPTADQGVGRQTPTRTGKRKRCLVVAHKPGEEVPRLGSAVLLRSSQDGSPALFLLHTSSRLGPSINERCAAVEAAVCEKIREIRDFQRIPGSQSNLSHLG